MIQSVVSVFLVSTFVSNATEYHPANELSVESIAKTYGTVIMTHTGTMPTYEGWREGWTYEYEYYVTIVCLWAKCFVLEHCFLFFQLNFTLILAIFFTFTRTFTPATASTCVSCLHSGYAAVSAITFVTTSSYTTPQHIRSVSVGGGGVLVIIFCAICYYATSTSQTVSHKSFPLPPPELPSEISMETVSLTLSLVIPVWGFFST